MNFVPFDLVEWQVRHEPSCTFSLADSGCQPAKLADIFDDPTEFGDLLSVEQGYGVMAGPAGLRHHIAQWHGAEAQNVLVTVGGTEANSIALDSLVTTGGHAVIVTPGYPQLTGCLLNHGVHVSRVALDGTNGWQLRTDELAAKVRPDTQIIVVTHPNNPTGTVLKEFEVNALIAAADRVGAWLVVDEVHRGTEIAGPITSTFWRKYDRVVCTGSMSKAFALPGLRIGWIVAPTALLKRAESRRHYTTIAATKLAARLAELAFTEPARSRLFNRTRDLIRNGHATLRKWVADSDGLVSMIDPTATAAGFVQYHTPEGSVQVADALRHAGVLVIPGAHFQVEHHLRITYGIEPSGLTEALQRISAVLCGLRR